MILFLIVEFLFNDVTELEVLCLPSYPLKGIDLGVTGLRASTVERAVVAPRCVKAV